jgi:uncharacterized membrane protein YphA (DoxX/SURF4 family)
MIRIIIGLFFILHGLVYLLYTGHSQRIFELKPGLLWPDGSWVFSKFQGEKTTRLLAGISCILAAIGFVTGGIIFFTGLEWWYTLITITAIFAIVVFILFWDGKFTDLDDKGWIGMLINLLILVALQFLNLNEL